MCANNDSGDRPALSQVSIQKRRPCTLGPKRTESAGGVHLRINDDVREAVVFIGRHEPSKDGTAKIVYGGTAFFLQYERLTYLVTARHVASQVDGAPFYIRVNTVDGSSIDVEIDRLDWHFHEDETVDVALVPLGIGSPAKYMNIPDHMILTDDRVEKFKIGIGTDAYVVGLFRMLTGNKRNLPVVHTGNIAMVPGDERIPVKDRASGKTHSVEGYLMEAHTLDGLSGSPVFARKIVRLTLRIDGVKTDVYANWDFALLGLWQGSWTASPDDVLGTELVSQGHRNEVRVPLGMGIVVPAKKFVDILEMPDVKADREAKIRAHDESLPAEQDAAFTSVENRRDAALTKALKTPPKPRTKGN